MSDRPAGMNAYEKQRWNEIEEWRSVAARRGVVDRLPDSFRERGTDIVEWAGELWDKVPGNDQVETALAAAIKGGFDMALDVTESTISEQKVVQRVTRGLSIDATAYDDIRGLDLAILDKRSPKNAKRRAALAAGHGAAAGLIAGGATAAGAASGGMGALPAAGVVALTLVADTAAVSVGSMQGAAYTGAHYGYDPSRPAERAMMMSLLGGALGADAAKMAALQKVRQLALDLAAKRSLQELSEGALYNLMLRVYGALMLNTAKRSIAKGVPVVGALVGAGVNYHTTRRTIVAASYAYPERWLVEKYDATGPSGAPRSEDATEIIDVEGVEGVEAAIDEAVGNEDQGILDRLKQTDDTEETPD